MTTDDSFPFDENRVEASNSALVASPLYGDRPRENAERTASRDQNDRGRERDLDQPNRRPPSMTTTLLATTVVALIAGAAGAAGYSHFFAPRPGEHSGVPAKSEARPDDKSISERKSREGSGDNGTAKEAGAETSTSSSLSAVNSSSEASELKQQIRNLDQKIDQLDERFDRVRQLLGLAIPLLQRIAPKN